MKLLVEEPGSEVARSAYESSGSARTVGIAYVEACSALARMRKGDRLSRSGFEASLQGLDRVWEALYVHNVTDAVIDAAARSAIARTLRAYDALHLAGALAFAAEESVEFACWDRDLRGAASAHGFALVPESL